MRKCTALLVFYDDAVNELIPKAYSDAYDECELDIVSQPEINVVQIEKGKPFIFTAEVATKPEVTLGEYKGLKVDKISTRVTQKEVDAKIQEEAEKNARTITVEDRPVQDGDEVILDFEGFVDGVAFEGGKGENYPLTIGSGAFIPGFEEQLIGADIRRRSRSQCNLPRGLSGGRPEGKSRQYSNVPCMRSRQKSFRRLDDEFAADVSEFDTLDEYKADVKAKIKEQQRDTKERRRRKIRLWSRLLPMLQMEIPEANDQYADQTDGR